ncbi:MAG: DNA polymerase III subunit gamma/tau [candidate division WOR-3 bacterium]|nr:MAG: DNA polymerase III subunit gamma/tau [candidate division WOR-3 bacterium]
MPSTARIIVTHRVISLRYRPQDFDELTGQSHVVLSLKGAIKSGRIGHAFLFSGPRGVGKTTAARIFAKSLNCAEGPTVHPCQKCQSCREIALSRSIDVIEVDGASNRGIDEIRNLREAVQYSPLHGKHKIYIIDEVHMLTDQAFNALLKTLEEPPPSVKFIFATTNPGKVPQTILSRCERFAFKRLSVKEICSRLKSITDKENISITDKALHYIALRAEGSIRDGESVLEQLVSFVEGKIAEDDVFKLIGFLSSEFYFDFMQKIVKGNHAHVLRALNEGIEDGAAPLEIYRGIVDYLRSALLVYSNMPQEFIDLSDDEIQRIRSLELNKEKIMSMLEVLLRSEDLVKRSMNTRIAAELLFCRLAMGNDPLPQKHGQASANDFSDELQKALQVQSPKLSALIQSSSIEVEGKNVRITVDQDFSRKLLMSSKDILEKTLKQVLKHDVVLQVDVGQNVKKDNNLEDAIRALFDGEEVR